MPLAMWRGAAEDRLLNPSSPDERGLPCDTRFTTPEIDAMVSRRLAAKLSPSTVRNRRNVLLHLWNRLDGLDGRKCATGTA